MSVHYGGNIVPEITNEEHDPVNNAKRVNVVAGGVGQATVNINGSATIFAVVNTGASSDPKTFIGLTTSVIGSAPTIFAVVNTAAAGQASIVLDTGANYIGLVSVSHAAWADPKTYIGLTTSTIGNGTLFAVVNDPVVADPKIFMGLVTAVQGGGGTKYIGLTTTTLGVGTSDIGLVTLNPSKAFIGLTTSVIGNAPILGASTNYIGLVTVANTVPVTLSGNMTLSDAKTYIGLTTATLGEGTRNIGLVTLNAGQQFIGLTTSVIGNAPILGASTNYIGLVTVANTIAIKGNLTLSDSTTFIGLTTVVQGGGGNKYIGLVTCTNGVGTSFMGLVTAQLGIGTTFIGLTTSVNAAGTSKIGLVTLCASDAWTGLNTVVSGVGTSFIGLVTAWTRNAGSAKTLTQLPIAFAAASVATIAVPTNANVIYVTNMILSSNATVRVAIKSGATYLVGNASLGIVLMPGGGFIQSGSPDSPCYIGLPSGSFNINKQDIGSTVAEIGGDIIYFEE